MKKIIIGLLIISLSGRDICAQFTPVPESSSISLNSKWKFNPSPGPEVFESSLFHNRWKDIDVPGEWIMQGFVVQPGVRACYQTLFLVPGGWDGKRIMLRFDAVYSDAIVWVNGKKAGTHTGGFNIFEIDITSLLKKGSNLLTVGVMNESIADTLSCGSQYAAHSLGGIPRKVTLFSVPDLHISDIFITTDLDDKYKNATLKLDLAFKDSGKEVSAADLEIDLFSPDGKSIWTKSYKIGQLQKKEYNDKIIIDVNNPLKWNAEYPSLYKLRLQLSSPGGTEIIERKVGVRKIEVVGNRVFLNGTAIKLHGINHHEVHPLKGRSLNMELWRKDAILYKEADIILNYYFAGGGTMITEYTFTSKEIVDPRQIGLVFSVPATNERLRWYRKGFWSSYPEWHIGRINGEAIPFPSDCFYINRLGIEPKGEWRFDANSLGTNDFRSTKENIYWAALTNPGLSGIVALSDGKQSFRSYVNGHVINFLVADYSNGGGEMFFASHLESERRPLNRGDKFSGKSILRIISSK